MLVVLAIVVLAAVVAIVSTGAQRRQERARWGAAAQALGLARDGDTRLAGQIGGVSVEVLCRRDKDRSRWTTVRCTGPFAVEAHIFADGLVGRLTADPVVTVGDARFDREIQHM